MKVAILSLGLLAAVGSIRADEVKIEIKDVPKAVLAAAKAKFPEGKVTGASKEEEDGETTYELAIEDGGAKIDIAVSPKGKILEVEKTINAEKLPKAVAVAIKAKYPGAKIKKAEEIVEYEGDDERGEKSFEVVLASEGKDSVEVKFSPEGKVLDAGGDEKGKPKDDDDDEKAVKEKGEKKGKG